MLQILVGNQHTDFYLLTKNVQIAAGGIPDPAGRRAEPDFVGRAALLATGQSFTVASDIL
ncbi:MAG: hypothetical protein SGI98_12020 [Verrucomicrobiota bacterium]|nr:hypothetical protein [Verrucomicrobiota bacterium]